MPRSDLIGYLLAVGKVFVLLVYLRRACCQSLPTRDEDNFRFQIRRDIFYDNNILPDGQQMTVYLFNGTRKKYFFMVEESNAPLQIFVTPCASPVSWSIKRKDLLTDEDDDETTAADPFLDHAFQTQMKSISSPTLDTFEGGGRMTYFSPNSPQGLYTIELEPTKSDTNVRIFGTTTPGLYNPFPELPSDSRVNVTALGRKSISFEWKGSKATSKKNVEYCISVSRLQRFQSHCAVLAHSQGDVPPTLPPDFGFGFKSEKHRQRELRRKSKPIKAVKPSKLFHKCVGRKTRFTFNRAKPGKTYFIDVFLVNRRTNQASSYTGTTVKTSRKRRRPSTRKQFLEDGKRKLFQLKKARKAQAFVFSVKDDMSSVVLELKSCRGVLPFEIVSSHIKTFKSVIKRTKIVRMKNLPAGRYTVRVKGNKRRRRYVQIYYTTRQFKYRKPRLPSDPSIKIFENLSTCNSVTVAWMGSDVKQRYCLYKKEVSEFKRKNRRRCSDPETRSRKERVVCVRFRHRDKDKAVITHTVRNLRPNTGYVFDVYVSRGRSGYLSYRSAFVRTKSKC
ncbi:protein NDNF-like [Gigantopelta aegis]|uniref:protein NDNF-like n=1 Tax=Gigantopelta aegis TaxID=1735272 RepID=UPI001B88BCCE|nr:protein NDNF-like [Gigantopelta aegis]